MEIQNNIKPNYEIDNKICVQLPAETLNFLEQIKNEIDIYCKTLLNSGFSEAQINTIKNRLKSGLDNFCQKEIS